MKKYLLKLSVAISALIIIGLPVQASAASMIGMINDSNVYVKTGSNTAPWTQLTNNITASNLKMYGDRIAFVDGGGNLWLKNGLKSLWYEQTSNVSKYDLTDSYLVVLKNDGTVWLKPGQEPTSEWINQMIADNTSQVYLSPNQMLIIKNNADLEGKTLNLTGDMPMMTIAQNATAAAVTDQRLVYVDSSQNVYGKDGSIGAAWWNSKGLIDHLVTQVDLSGNTYCAVQDHPAPSGPDWEQLGCSNPDFGQGSANVFSYFTSNFDLAPNTVVVKGDRGYGESLNALNWPQGSSSGWTTLSTTGTEVTTNHE